jgi:enoyl-[acyl-carrier-protein] reductase (NADH)
MGFAYSLLAPAVQIGATAVFLASPLASYITGATVVVDGVCTLIAGSAR